MELDNDTLTFKLYYLLKKKPQSIETLLVECTVAGFKISVRSIYRHVLKIEKSLDHSIEILETEIIGYRKQVFFIRSVVSTNLLSKLNGSEWTSLITHLFLNTKTSHQNFSQNKEFAELAEKIKLKSPLKVKENFPIETFSKQLFNTQFGQAEFTNNQQKILIDLMWCISNNVYFIINEYETFTTNNYKEQPKVGELLIPIKAIYHRNDFIIKCYSVKSKKSFTLEFDKIKNINIHHSNFKHTKIELENDGHDFGFHPPISKTVYRIKLLFPPTPGAFIMNRFWHKSQKFKERKEGFILMTLEVRICIELLGWIMQWMDNVQILSPVIIKNIIGQRIENMKLINDNKILPISNVNSLKQ
jgi:hypothetical protein